MTREHDSNRLGKQRAQQTAAFVRSSSLPDEMATGAISLKALHNLIDAA
jgi:hypothetical protein